VELVARDSRPPVELGIAWSRCGCHTKMASKAWTFTQYLASDE
jgi:hypothetical protein